MENYYSYMVYALVGGVSSGLKSISEKDALLTTLYEVVAASCITVGAIEYLNFNDKVMTSIALSCLIGSNIGDVMSKLKELIPSIGNILKKP